MEQFIVRVPEALAIWLKEKEPKSLTEAVELANTYALAREDGGKGDPKETPPSEATPRGGGKQEPHQVESRVPTEQKGRDQTNQHGEKRCFQCNRFGHMIYNCMPLQGDYYCSQTQLRPFMEGPVVNLHGTSRVTSIYDGGDWMVIWSRCWWTPGRIRPWWQPTVLSHRRWRVQKECQLWCPWGHCVLPHSSGASPDGHLAAAGQSGSCSRVACSHAPGLRLVRSS